MNKPAVLIVDKELQFRQLLRELLSKDFECAIAGSTEEAIAQLNQKEFAVVISDLKCLDHSDLIQCINQRSPDTAVVVTSGFASVEHAISALHAGAFDYLVKPFDLDSLVITVKRASEHYQLVKENRSTKRDILQAIQRERALEELRRFIGHEFHHVLAPLNAYIKMLEEVLDKPNIDRDKLRSLVTRIRTQNDTAFELVNRYLKYSQPLVPDWKRTDLNVLLKRSVDEIRSENKTRRIRLQSRLPEGTTIEADADLLVYVLRNVLANALDATKDGDTIRVSSQQTNGNLVIAISDTGTGIKPEHIPHVFDFGVSTKTGTRGAGMGLALSKRIVEAHHGTIGIKNNSNGQKGVTVTITIPTSQTEVKNEEQDLTLATG